MPADDVMRSRVAISSYIAVTHIKYSLCPQKEVLDLFKFGYHDTDMFHGMEGVIF
jgi:hypothetical protein